MRKLLLGFALTTAPVLALAQTAPPSTDSADGSAPSRWRLGLGVVSSDNGYLGRSRQITPFPLVSYEGERFFIRGITGGVHLYKQGGLQLDAIVTPGFNNIDADDFGRTDLARRGIDRDDLEDRDRSIEAGVALSWRGTAGAVRFEAKNDVSGNSKGQEYAFSYEYPLQWGAFRISPSIGATYLSDKVANYYYGTHKAEVAKGVPDYRPGGALLPQAGVSVMRPIGDRWAVMLNARYTSLPGKISDSPLVGANHGSTVFVGFTRSF